MNDAAEKEYCGKRQIKQNSLKDVNGRQDGKTGDKLIPGPEYAGNRQHNDKPDQTHCQDGKNGSCSERAEMKSFHF
jgi:hypothetical protein